MIELVAVDGIGEVRSGDDLAALVLDRVTLRDGDVVVVTSKIVSKAAGLATRADRDDLLAAETDRVVARRGVVTIVRTRHGLTLAAGGIDASNVDAGMVLPLPRDPDVDARALRAALAERSGATVAVVISDTAGRAWRHGQTDIAIGCAGIVPLESYAGIEDAHGNTLAVTAPAVPDEIASAAEIASGKLGGRPVVIARGVDARLLTADDGPGAAAIIRDEQSDLFGLGATDAVVAALTARGTTVRGFVTHAVTPADLVALADVPAGLSVAVAETVMISDDGAGPVEAGALRQRLESLATAHGVALTVLVAGM